MTRKLNKSLTLLSALLLAVLVPVSAGAAPGWVGRVMESVVVVRSQPDSGRVLGSGFVVSEELVATSAHAVRSENVEVLVQEPGEELERLDAEVARLDPVQDLVLLRVENGLPAPLSIAAVEPDEDDLLWTVAAELTDNGIIHSVTSGRVRSLQDGMLVHDASQRPGFSGAPLLTSDGLLAGMSRQTVAGGLSAGPGMGALRSLLFREQSEGPPGLPGDLTVEPLDPEELLPSLEEAYPEAEVPSLTGAEWESAEGRAGYHLPWTSSLYELSRTSRESYQLTWRDLELAPESRLLPEIAVEVVRSQVEFDEFVNNYTERFLLERGYVEMETGNFEGLNTDFSIVVTGKAVEGEFRQRLVAFSEGGSEDIVEVIVFTYPWFGETTEAVDAVISTTLNSFRPS